MSKIGVMICGHGSRSQAAVDQFSVLAEKLPAYLPPEWAVEYGYLEFANPVIRDGLDRLRAQGCDKILAVPGMLFAAMHSKNDIPTVLNTYAAKHGIEVSYGRELGLDPKMIAAAGGRVQEAIAAANAAHGEVPMHETCLVVIGRGASDPDANGNVAKIARMLHEGLGFGWCEVGYSGVTFPLVEPCLQHASRLGYKRIVVFPYFLFSGILIDRIYGFTDQVAAEHADIQFVKAGYLNDHEQVLATFAERITEQVGENSRPIAPCANIARRFWDLRLKWVRFKNRIIIMWKGKAPQRPARMLRIANSVTASAQVCADWRNRPKGTIIITATAMTTATITGMDTVTAMNMCMRNIPMRITRMGRKARASHRRRKQTRWARPFETIEGPAHAPL